MPFAAYGVLSGTLLSHRRDDPDNFGRWYHVHLTLEAAGRVFEVAVDVDSKQSNTGVQWKTLPLETADVGLAAPPSPGFHLLASASSTGALDYIRLQALLGIRLWRSPIVLFGPPQPQRRGQWLPGLPPWQVGDFHAATLALEEVLQLGATVLVWGEPYPKGAPNAAAVDGLHNVHQNQGDPPGSQWWADDGIWQDGGVSVQQPNGRWKVFISRFSTQSSKTNSAGHPYMKASGNPA